MESFKTGKQRLTFNRFSRFIGIYFIFPFLKLRDKFFRKPDNIAGIPCSRNNTKLVLRIKKLKISHRHSDSFIDLLERQKT